MDIQKQSDYLDIWDLLSKISFITWSHGMDILACLHEFKDFVSKNSPVTWIYGTDILEWSATYSVKSVALDITEAALYLQYISK